MAANPAVIAQDPYPAFPDELKALPRWVLWNLEARDGKATKIPYAVAGGKADSTNQATWTTYAEAAAYYNENWLDVSGLGCVIAPPYVGIDLDKCRDPESGHVEEWAQQALTDLSSYTELSPSGKGFHIWVRATLPPGGNRRGSIEMYGEKRYFTITGKHVPGTPTTINDIDLTAFHQKHIAAMPTTTQGKVVSFPETNRDESPSAKEWALACEIARELGPKATEAEVTVEFFKRATERTKWLTNKSYVSRTIRNAIEKVHGAQPASTSSKAVETQIIQACFEDIEVKIINWLWKDRIPQGKLTIFSGNPDVGKSTVSIDVIARYTTGTPFPDGADACEPRDVLMMIAEDDPGDTIKPRLMAAGADLKRVFCLKGVEISHNAKKKERMIALDSDLALLENHLRDNPNIGLVVVDPLTSYLGKADMGKEQRVREVLIPIKELCERTGVTFICLGHFNKRADVSALHKVGGAVAMSGVPRAVWLFAKNPEEKGEYLMMLGKGNLTKKRGGLKYCIGEKALDTGSAPYIVWGGEAENDADTVFSASRDPELNRQQKITRFLEEYLANGPKASDHVFAAGKEHGFSRGALFNAKKVNEGIRCEKIGHCWWWSLAGEEHAR